MLIQLSFRPQTAQSIVDHYEQSNTEKILIFYLKKSEKCYSDAAVIVPKTEDYRVIGKENLVSLHPAFLLACIQECLDHEMDGILLMHNHLEKLPLFSSDDREASMKFARFFRKNQIDLIAGNAVYANRQIIYILERPAADQETALVKRFQRLLL